MMRALPCVLILAVWCAACGGPAARSGPRPVPVAGHDVLLPPDGRLVSAKVAPGATLASLLRGLHVSDGDVAAAVARAASVFDLRKVRADQPYRLEESDDGELRRFEYEIDGDRLLRVDRPPEAGSPLVAAVLPIEKTQSLAVVRGSIDGDASSLVAAMDDAGETVDLSLALADIFSGEIDFNSDIQPGDSFELVVEKQYRKSTHAFAGYGPILAAEFENDGRTLRAVRFTPEGSGPGYYDEHGVSLRRFFLRSPLKFQPVVTSGFSRHRFHPVLRRYRPHLGVDYRAPIGAPVVAAADGVVVEAGWKGGDGRMVHLRHTHGFETLYLHLSSIAVHRGARVRQGDLLGRVGMSGLATGPHLDYRLKKNGAFVNPLTAHRAMPPGDPIPVSQMPEFVSVRDRVLGDLGSPEVAAAAEVVAAHQP